MIYIARCSIQKYTIGACKYLSFTTEHIVAIIIRLKLTILFITQIISTLIQNYYNAKKHSECESFTTLHTDDPQFQKYYSITCSERGSFLL